MNWEQMWGGVNGRFTNVPALQLNRIEGSTEQQQEPKRQVVAAQVPIPEPARQAAAAPAPEPQAAGGALPRSQEELDLARRRAFLGSSDSLAGSSAVRGVLADEVQARSGERPDPAKETTRSLESRLAKLQGEGNAYLGAMPAGTTAPRNGAAPDLSPAFTAPAGFQQLAPHSADVTLRQAPDGPLPGPGAFAEPDAFEGFAPPGNAAQAGINAWMQTGLRESLKNEPITKPADWQLNPQALPAPQTDPWRDAGLAAAAAAGVELPTTEGESVARLFATGPMGSRNGQGKAGNTMPLGFRKASSLPPINSRLTVSGPAALF